MAILGASFLLTWACEVAQMDIPQAVAVAVVAFIAVLPEYAVDMYFTWMAGQHPESAYSHYAIANMTGANRLLIGVGWSSIVLVFARRFHTGVSLPDDKRTDVLFLGLATIYALFIPLKGSLTWAGRAGAGPLPDAPECSDPSSVPDGGLPPVRLTAQGL